MSENEIARVIVDCAVKLHIRLGPGLLESVYEVVLAYELRARGLEVERQLPIPIKYENIIFEEGFRIDLMVGNKVIVELKAIEKLEKVHKAQLSTYLRLTDKKLGILINFGEAIVKDGIHRVVNGLEEKKIK